ncbi:MAG: YkgJ family cysteine cluster protein [Bacteroidota bacterium]|nr:YkgJ family cysteine cluster protein [Bacteroidota bacterium]
MNDEFYNISFLKDIAKKKKKSNKKLVSRLKKLKSREIDSIVQKHHYEVFEYVDCLKCANCCKNISPIITDRDIVRIAKHLKMRAIDFIQKYLNMDEEGDYVYKQAPCPFLLDDNYCSIYEFRPKACAEYPHTDRVRVYQALDLSLKNSAVCPAVYEIFEKIKSQGY